MNVDVGQGEHVVCKLHKSIYGLKHASRQWFTSSMLLLFDMVLISLNFFVHKRASSKFIALLVYVNDVIITSPNETVISFVRSFLTVYLCSKILALLNIFRLRGCSLQERHFSE